MAIDTKHALYLKDLRYLLRDQAFGAKKHGAEADEAVRDFERGRLMAYIEVLSLMQQQATAFGLPFKDLCLDDLDVENDLLF